MPKPFKLIAEKFSEIDKEWQWTYQLKITFNYQPIIKATITDHYLIKYKINNDLIMELLEEMNEGTFWNQLNTVAGERFLNERVITKTSVIV